MKAFLVLLQLVTWMDLEVGERLTLAQDIDLVTAQFPAGETLDLRKIESVAVPGAPLVLYTLNQVECADPELESDMEIVTPLGSPDARAVGVQLYKGCVWEIYIEQKDLLSSSLFIREL